MKRFSLISLAFISLVVCAAQTTNDFNEYRQQILNNFNKTKGEIFDNYNSFRNRINSDYANFLRNEWKENIVIAPIPKPDDNNPIPPIVFEDNQDTTIFELDIEHIVKPQILPSPKPIEPIKENENNTIPFSFDFYGLKVSLRTPKTFNSKLTIAPDDIASSWEHLSQGNFDNTLIDLLLIRENNQLCDWAYLQLLEKFSNSFLLNKNQSTLLTAWLLCQSGYQIRLGHDSTNLIILFASNHIIFEKSYFELDGIKYYPLSKYNTKLQICNVRFEGERPLSLAITKEQIFGQKNSGLRTIKSNRFPDVNITVSVNENYIEFYNFYPTSAIGENPLSRWALCADAPLSEKTKAILYPSLIEAIGNCSKLDAVNKLLNWVQTGLVYEYDDKIWGHDRAFFVEETLYYPYADCEDRSILFSRLVRDLLDLDVALIYYPGHLATAVKFATDVQGDAVRIDGKRYIVCDPTYFGAPVGSQMPGLEYDKVQAIILKDNLVVE